MAISSFATGLTEGVFRGMDWREARAARKRRQEILDQEQEWRGQDRERNQRIEDEKLGVWRDEVAYTKEERKRAREKQAAEEAAWEETFQQMRGNREGGAAPAGGEGAAPASNPWPAIQAPSVPLAFDLDAPGAMTEAPTFGPRQSSDGQPPLPEGQFNPSQQPAPVLDAPVPVPEGWRAPTRSPDRPQRPQEPDAAPDALPAERREGAPPSSQAEMSIMDMAVEAARKNARAGKASDGLRAAPPAAMPAPPEQGPPVPGSTSLMDDAVQAAQLNGVAGQTRGRPLAAPQGRRPDWLPPDYLLPPEFGPEVNQTAPVQGQPTGPQGAAPAWLPATALPGPEQVVQASAPNRPQPPVAGIGRGAPLPPEAAPQIAPAPAPPAAPPARAQGTMATEAPQVPTTTEGTPVASVAVAAETAPPQSTRLTEFGVIGKDGAVKATPAQFDRAAKAGVKAYTTTEMPKIVEHYLRTGQIEKAAAFEKFVQDKKTQEGMQSWMKAIHALNIGDTDTFVKGIVGAYNTYYDDGFTALEEESTFIKDDQGKLAAAKIAFRNDKTGEVFFQEFSNTQDMLMAVVGQLSPEGAYDTLFGMAFPKKEKDNSADLIKIATEAVMKDPAMHTATTQEKIAAIKEIVAALSKNGGDPAAAPAEAPTIDID